MSKILLTYLFAFILMTSVVVPTCLTIFENTCEQTVEMDIDEESKTKEIEEVKIFNKTFYNIKTSFNQSVKTIVFCAKDYNSVIQSQELPPPEVLI